MKVDYLRYVHPLTIVYVESQNVIYYSISLYDVTVTS